VTKVEIAQLNLLLAVTRAVFDLAPPDGQKLILERLNAFNKEREAAQRLVEELLKEKK
jgi:hypothetical protein